MTDTLAPRFGRSFGSAGFGSASMGGGAGSAQLRWTPILGLILAAELAITALLVLAPREEALAAIALLLGMGVLAAAMLKLPAVEREPLFVILAAGFLIRLVVLGVLHYGAISAINPHGFLVPDSWSYDRVGWHVAQHWRQDTATRLGYHTAGFAIGYHYTVAWIYTIAGHAPLLIKALNVVLSTSLVPLTFVIGRELAGRRSALAAALLIALWPPLIFWSVQILKDVLIAFLLALAIWGWIAFVRRPRLWRFAVALAPAIPLVFLRAYAFLFWAIGIAIGLAFLAVERRRLALALGLIVLLGSATWLMVAEFSPALIAGLDLRVHKLDLAGSVAGSMVAGARLETVSDVIAFMPVGVARFLLAPLPWKEDVREIPLHYPEALGSILRYFLLPFAAIGMVAILRAKRVAVLPIVVCGLLTIALYAIAFRGGVPRHMTQFYPVFMIFAATGIPRWPNWPLPLAFAWGTVLVAALALTWGY